MSAPSKTRIAWVDNVKMVAMLFVMLGHTWRLIHCPLPLWLNEFILSFNMALFVMMTGYTSVGAIGRIVDLRSLWDYVFKITKRILLPAALFYLAFFWIIGPLTMKKLLIAAAKILFVAGVAFVYYKGRNDKRWKLVFDIICLVLAPYAIFRTGYWFFAMIWCVCASVAVGRCLYIYIGKLFHRKEDTGGIWPAFAGLALLALVVSMPLNFIHDKTSDFLPFFLLGFAGRLLTGTTGIGKVTKAWTILLALLCLGGGWWPTRWAGPDTMNFWEFHFLNALRGGTPHLFLLRIAASTLLCLFFILITRVLSKTYNRFSYWGSETLPLYLIHAWIVSVFFYQLNLEVQLNDWQYLLFAIPATALLLVASQGIIRLLDKFKSTRALFLGKLDYI